VKALALALCLGCASTPDPAPVDAGAVDVGNDIGMDVRNDIGNDVGNDVGNDLGADAPVIVDVARREDGAAVVTLADIEALVFRPHCAVPSCHASAEPTGRMRLDEDFPRSTLRDVGAMGVSCRDQGFVRVVPGDVGRSLLYRKITEDAPPCGSRMPQSADPLSPELIGLVRDWIASGAP
jgi:hypothetical protein